MTTEKEVMCMSKKQKNEKTSAKVAALAAKVLAGYRPNKHTLRARRSSSPARC
jgi:hypothetical protein